MITAEQTQSRTNPLRVMLAIIGIVLLMVMALLIAAHFYPSLRKFVPQFPETGIVNVSGTAIDVLGQIDGADTPYYTTGSANNAPTNARGVNDAGGVAIDSDNHRLFVSDTINSRVLVYDLDISNNLVDRVADHVLGQPDFKTNYSPIAANTLYFPMGLVFDGDSNRLFVFDALNNRVMVFNTTNISDGEDAVHVIGQPDFESSAIAISSTSFSGGVGQQRQIAFDSVNKRLFVPDNNRNGVLVFDVTSVDDGEPAINIIGVSDFVTAGGAVIATRNNLYDPRSLAYDTNSDRLFVGDQEHARVVVYDADPGVLIANNPSTDGPDAINVIGQSDYITSTKTVSQNGLSVPQSLALDTTGERLFVVDIGTPLDRVMVFDVDPSVLIPNDSASDGPNAINVLGVSTFTDTSGGLSRSQLSAPQSVAYDESTDLLYVGEQNNNRVMIFNASTTVLIPNNAGTDGPDAVNALGQLDENDQPIYTSGTADNVPNAQGFSGISAVALDSVHHRLFTSDTVNNRVMVFNLAGDNSLADHTADAVLGQPDFKTVAAVAVSSTSLSSPLGLAYDALHDRLFISDSVNKRVVVYDATSFSNGQSAVHVLGAGDLMTVSGGASSSTIDKPNGLAYDSLTDMLYVADEDNNRVLVFDVSPGTLVDGGLATFVLGQTDFTSTGFAASQTELADPSAIAMDSVGHRLFVTDNGSNRVMIWDFDVIPLTNGASASAVLGQTDFSGTSFGTDANHFKIEGTEGGSRNPGLSYDGVNDRLFVGDQGNNRVLVFNVASISNGQDAIDVYGQDDFTTANTGTTQNTFTSLSGVVADGVNNRLYVSDTANNRVMIFGAAPGETPTPTPTDTITPTPSEPPGGGPKRIGFFPEKILVNNNDTATPTRNSQVSVYAHYSTSFEGTVEVLLSNTTDFKNFISFRYTIEGIPGADRNWVKTVPWDLCYGLSPAQCDPGHKIVYARFYVNQPAPTH